MAFLLLCFMFISFNGKLLPAEEPVLLSSNRGYRYGDGLFETMKIVNGKIGLEALHIERLMKGIALLKIELPGLFTPEKLVSEALQLAVKNKATALGRVRLSVFRGNGGLYDAGRTLQYLIECWPLPESFLQLNQNGLEIGVFPDACKSIDPYSGLKTANFLPYTMASIFAKEQKLNDCLVLNTAGTIADSTIANLFIYTGDRFLTPGPAQGAVGGVMRSYLINEMRASGYTVEEAPVTIAELEKAKEVFLTNAIHGIKWVRTFRDSHYQNLMADELYSRFVQTIQR